MVSELKEKDDYEGCSVHEKEELFIALKCFYMQKKCEDLSNYMKKKKCSLHTDRDIKENWCHIFWGLPVYKEFIKIG